MAEQTMEDNMAKARLGKGLAALFPPIEEEETPKSTQQKSAGKQDLGNSEPAQAGQTKKAGKASEASANQASTPAKKKSSTAKSTAKSSKESRKGIPDWSEIVHPSDMFFSATHPGDEVKEVAEKPSDESATNEALFEDLHEVAGAYLVQLPVDSIEANSHQPRTLFDEEELKELSDSIKEVGVLQPIVVRKIDAVKKESHQTPIEYELIMGERRLRASKLAGVDTIPAIVRTTSDEDMLRDALLENLHRVQLNPLEEAAAYQQMIDEFGLTQAKLSKSVSKSRPQIANTLRLLQLPSAVQKRVASGVLSAGHARALLSLDSEEKMLALATRIVAEGLSVRSTEEIVAMQKLSGTNGSTRQKSSKSYWANSPLPAQLGDRFDTQVTISGTQEKGRIKIAFGSSEDLHRIMKLLGGEKETDSTNGWV